MVEDEDQNQELAFCLSNGHNLIISGQAGAGKTYVIKRIIRHWKHDKKIAIVCSTGISSTHYGDLWATTLHKWAGIEDGRHANEDIIHWY